MELGRTLGEPTQEVIPLLLGPGNNRHRPKLKVGRNKIRISSPVLNSRMRGLAPKSAVDPLSLYAKPFTGDQVGQVKVTT